MLTGTAADRKIGALARAQHGVVARPQLLKAGVGRHAIAQRLERRTLNPIHRGVYLVGHQAPSSATRWMGAALCAGPGGLVTHIAAAALASLTQARPHRIDITVRGPRRRAHGICWRRSSIPADERTTEDGIPTTRIARTLFDIAATEPPETFVRIARQAEFRQLEASPSLAELLTRYPRRPGSPTVRRWLENELPDPGVPHEVFEERFDEMLRGTRLPPPIFNMPLKLPTRFIRVDCAWPAARVALELDGRASHERRAQMADDRKRDRELTIEGWIPVRYTWGEIASASGRRSVIGELDAILERTRSVRAG